MELYKAIPELLERAELEVVFGLYGSANVGWVGHGVTHGSLRWVGVRHESAAVTAAGAYARATGRIGVVSTTLGPGFANTVNSLAASLHDHSPMLFFVGQSPTGKGGGDYQRLNQRGLAEALGVGFHELADPSELSAVFWRARRATLFNGVPQIISIDEKFLQSETEVLDDPSDEPVLPHEVDREVASAIAHMLADASRPLLIAGRGADLSGCRAEMIELAELSGALLGSTLAVHHFFRGHPQDVGVCGVSSSPATLEVIGDVDAVFAVGASFNWYTRAEDTLYVGARIAQCEISIDADVKASSPELALLGDGRAGVRAVIDAWKEAGLERTVEPVATPSWDDIRASMLRTDLGNDPARGLDLRGVYADLDELLPEDRIVITDGGRAMRPVPSLLGASGSRSWVPSRAYGSIGLSIPAAIGTTVGNPDVRTVVVCGDAGFMMSAQELDTFRRMELDVTIVVMNDEQLASELKYLRRLGLDKEIVNQSMPDLVQFARTFGGDGVVVTDRAQLRDIDFTRPGVQVIDVRIDPEVDPANV